MSGSRLRTLVVSAEEPFFRALEARLDVIRMELQWAPTTEAAIEALSTPDLGAVVLQELPDGADVAPILERILEIAPGIPIVVIARQGSVAGAVDAMRHGASSYLESNASAEQVLTEVDRTAGPRGSRGARAEMCGIVGRSPGMLRVFETIERVAPTKITVAIFGESGTGKELVARAVHDLSPRAQGPFLAINCAALPEQLLQSELFGYKRGAFTGAQHDRDGLFQQATGGTLFLDEIGDLSPSTQVSLLRVLQESEVMPIGGRAPVKVDVRVVVATHRDLKQAVAAGRFREDLLYRVNVAAVQLPALRERGSDVEILADHFVTRFSQKHNRHGLALDEGARQAIFEYAWPGNVRELQHALERSVVMAESHRITALDLFPGGVQNRLASAPGIRPLREARDAWEREYLTKLLDSTGGNVSAAARAAHKYRADLYALLRKHDLDPEDFKRRES